MGSFDNRFKNREKSPDTVPSHSEGGLLVGRGQPRARVCACV